MATDDLHSQTDKPSGGTEPQTKDKTPEVRGRDTRGRNSMVRTILMLALAAGLMTASQPQRSMGSVRVEHLDQGVPERINIQGYLTDSLHHKIHDDVQMGFSVWSSSSGGDSLWGYSTRLAVDSGLFCTVLQVPASVFLPGAERWLKLSVESVPLQDRVEITSAAYAYRSIRSDTAAFLEGSVGYADSAGGALRVGGLGVTGLDGRYVNEGQGNSVTSSMIVNSTVLAEDLNRMNASTNQVLKWTGSAWAPRDDSVGGGGGSVGSVAQATGIICTPNPITTTGTVRFDQAWGDGRYVNTTGSEQMSGDLEISGTLWMRDGITCYGPGVEFRTSGGTRRGWIRAEVSSTELRYGADQAHHFMVDNDHVMSVYNDGVVVHKNLVVQGSKNFVQPNPDDPSTEIVYTCLEGGESGTYIRGQGRLEAGLCVVQLPEHFGLVTSGAGLTALVTPRADCNGVYVESVTARELVVRELNGGTSEAPFDFLVQGVRSGYENLSVVRPKSH